MSLTAHFVVEGMLKKLGRREVRMVLVVVAEAGIGWILLGSGSQK